MAELRRADDDRYRELSDRVAKIAADVQTIRELLITEPEASPLGRSLLERSRENRRLIDAIRADLEPLEDWYQQTRGVWRFVLGVATVLSIVATFFGILAYFTPR
jgi:hypothetical protein